MTTTFDSLVQEVRGVLRGFGLVQEGRTFLSGNITNSATSFSVTDGTVLAPGLIEIDREVLDVVSISGNALTIAPDGRGWDGTTAASHLANARVTANPPYPTWRIERALNDAITGVFPDLFGTATTSFTYNPAVTTYSMPADAQDVLQVTAPVIGPSKEQVELTCYKFSSNVSTSAFATGNCLTLLEAPDPGRTVTVVYSKQPTELVSGNAFTLSGLRESARSAVIYGAVARLLSFIDSTRAVTGSGVGSEFADLQRVGTATQLAAQMTARYEMELRKEQDRLRKAYPVKWRWVGR